MYIPDQFFITGDVPRPKDQDRLVEDREGAKRLMHVVLQNPQRSLREILHVLRMCETRKKTEKGDPQKI